MSSPHTIRRTVTIENPQGLHARPAYLFAELASRYESTIELEKDGERINGKSILSILSLAAAAGSEITVNATGDDAEDAIEALVGLIKTQFSGPEETAKAN